MNRRESQKSCLFQGVFKGRLARWRRNKVRELSEQAEELIDRGNQAVTRKQEQIATAIDAGREAYQREKSKAHVA